GGLADLLDGGQQQADQDGDDRDHHQQLDQREGTPACVNGNHGSSFERVQRGKCASLGRRTAVTSPEGRDQYIPTHPVPCAYWENPPLIGFSDSDQTPVFSPGGPARAHPLLTRE